MHFRPTYGMLRMWQANNFHTRRCIHVFVSEFLSVIAFFALDVSVRFAAKRIILEKHKKW